MAPNLILLHGFTNTGASWDQVTSALPERYRSLAPDIRGHGIASAVRPVSLAGVVADVGTAAAEGFELAGYSMGGRLALHAALALPERVRRLVLIGASPGIADPGERDQRRAADDRLAAEVERMTIEAFAERWSRTGVLADQPADVRAAVHRDCPSSTCRWSWWWASATPSSRRSRPRWLPRSPTRGCMWLVAPVTPRISRRQAWWPT
jgi:pimeloyl-ACP methyl ester carboxylesterase